MEDTELLRRYVWERSEDAFHELVRRKLPLVYSAALRQMGGDVHRTNDVTQAVFTALARHAESLIDHPSLTGWLYKTTRYAVLTAIRTERRRQHWEKESSLMNANDAAGPQDSEVSWSRIGAVLDEAMHALNERDREAVLLRYFEDQSHASIGKRLGLSEDAARQRIDRALDRLQQTLARRGVVSTASVLTAGLAQAATASFPAGFAAATSGAALAAAATAGSAGASLAFLTVSKTTLTAAAGLGLLALGAFYQVEASRLRTGADALAANQTIAALQADLQSLRQQIATVPVTPPSFVVVAPPNPEDELIARLTGLSRMINEGGLTDRIIWEKASLRETVAGIATALELSPEKIEEMQKIAEGARQQILANALRAAEVTRLATGGVNIITMDLPENRALYESMMESYANLMGPARYGFFESLNAKEAVNELLVQNGLGVRSLNVSLGPEARPGYLYSLPNKAGTKKAGTPSRGGGMVVGYPPGTVIRLSTLKTREELKAAMGPFGTLLPDDI